MASHNYNPPPSPGDEGAMMKGDAVGNTMYSERWIIKILMQLTKLAPEEWNTDLENEVCVLWDMSAEKDVVHLLMQHDMFGLAMQIVVNFDNFRLTEIMVGIIGNMCCVESVRTELGKRRDVVHVLFELLSMPDVPTLLQVLRVLQCCAWDVKHLLENISKDGKVEKSGNSTGVDETLSSDVQMTAGEGVSDCEQPGKSPGLEESPVITPSEEVVSPWLSHFLNLDLWHSKVLFILSSSKHDELLSSTWSFLGTVCYIPAGETVLSQQIADPNLMMALVESYKEVFEESFKTYETNDIEPVKKAASHWVSVLYSFTLNQEGLRVLCQFKADVLSCMFNMLHYCHSVLTLDEEFSTFITSSVAILDVIFSAEPHEWSHFTAGLLSTIKLWEELSESKSVKLKDDQSIHLEEEALKSLEDFFVSIHKWLEEQKHEDSYKKLHFIHKQLSQLLNSRVT